MWIGRYLLYIVSNTKNLSILLFHDATLPIGFVLLLFIDTCYIIIYYNSILFYTQTFEFYDKHKTIFYIVLFKVKINARKLIDNTTGQHAFNFKRTH